MQTGLDSHTAPSPHGTLLWDVFCQVIDNFGDIGVCWRLSADLASRGHAVRLWVDDPSALQWMAPGALEGTWPRVQVRPWTQLRDTDLLRTLSPAQVWVEGFGCEIAPEFIASYLYSTRQDAQFHQQFFVWMNLEYLSAESYVERTHGLPSPVMSGMAQGHTKHFFYPGFTAHTGGLPREPDLMERQEAFILSDARKHWLAQHDVTWTGERLVSLFCYEPDALPALLAGLDALPDPTLVLVTAGRATAAALGATRKIPRLRNVRLAYLAPLTQIDYDRLLWACDLNCVRGEDSLVRAIWAGKPMLWQIYPQHDAAHVNKLNAFLDMLNASQSLRAIHHAWNATNCGAGSPTLSFADLASWAQSAQAARARLLKMDDLVTQLIDFVAKKR